MRRNAQKRRPRVKTVSALKKIAWKLLSELVRRSAAKACGNGDLVNCYTCHACMPWNGGITGMNAGHAIPGRSGAVLLDEEIIRPQCNLCNAKPPFGRGGEYHLFATRLIRENGMDWWEKKLSTSRQIKKWTRPELEELIESYKGRLTELETKA